MHRRAVAALLVVLSAVTAVAVPASAAAKTAGVELLASTVPAMLPGQQGWVGLTWTAVDDVCDVQVTASGSGVGITYPANTSTFSSLFQNSSMIAGGIDFSAVNLRLPAAAHGTVSLTVTVSYRVVPKGHAGDAAWCKGGSRTTSTHAVTVPVTTYSGPAFTQKTAAVTVPRGAPAWVNLAFTGYSPTVTNFTVALSAPAGLTVTYPGDAAAAGLHNGAALGVGYDDFASVRLDASKLALGAHTVPITVTSGAGTGVGSIQLTVT